MEKREQLMKEIGIVSFVVIEFALYLDTHPEDRKAMEYYNHYCRMKTQMEREFAKIGYPLTLDYAESGKEWRWGEAPLPWEGACC